MPTPERSREHVIAAKVDFRLRLELCRRELDLRGLDWFLRVLRFMDGEDEDEDPPTVPFGPPSPPGGLRG